MLFLSIESKFELSMDTIGDIDIEKLKQHKEKIKSDDIIYTSEKVADIIRRMGAGIGIIIILIGIILWILPIASDVIVPLFDILPLWAKVVFSGIWIAVGAIIAGIFISTIGTLFRK